MTNIAPGWHPEPGNPSLERYWDGAQWTPETRSIAAQRVAPKRRPVGSTVWVAVGAIVVVLAGVGVWWLVAGRTATTTVHGTLTIEGGRNSGNYLVSAPDSVGNTSCEGAGGYSDISAGVAVRVTDDSGATVGTGSLEKGIWISGGGGCLFGWQVTVPDGKDSYGVTISHRGTIQFTSNEMKNGPDLTIGGS